ncbi:MAG TPA: FAD-binding oxidoreductase [Solirubrobacteraceae bacterium]|nr:FAD-binding oxidoreductase [Solirubrobacteraceae bacterium]
MAETAAAPAAGRALPAEPGEPPVMRWWGWGVDAGAGALPAHALSFLRENVGLAERPSPPVALANVHLPEPALSNAVLSSLRGIVGSDEVRDSHAERVVHTAGKGYADLVRLRSGEPEGAPDAVVLPASAAELAAVLQLCARTRTAVVPFGGGTSVVGGVAPLRGENPAVIALDTKRLRAIELDRESLLVTVGAGTRAPALESYLASLGLTLGHFPQSYEFVSLGGCAATRSAGQASSGYGAIAEMVTGLRMHSPERHLDLAAFPATAAGPDLRALVVGSEGTLGVISELTLRVRIAPATRVYEGVFFESFDAGVAALRSLAREHAVPDVARLSDEEETRMSLALAGVHGVKDRLGRAYLALRGYRGGCLAILGFEGSEDEVSGRRKRALALVRRAGGLAVGSSPGEAWRRSRFAAPYLRDELLTHGVLVETLETATRWSNLVRLRAAVARALEEALRAHRTPPLVFCHVSHVYETGASLYFTFIARQREGEEVAQWREAKEAASAAICTNGGTITHHHAVGRDHAPWMRDEIGADGIATLRALKAELDPSGIMNPRKLLP